MYVCAGAKGFHSNEPLGARGERRDRVAGRWCERRREGQMSGGPRVQEGVCDSCRLANDDASRTSLLPCVGRGITVERKLGERAKGSRAKKCQEVVSAV